MLYNPFIFNKYKLDTNCRIYLNGSSGCIRGAHILLVAPIQSLLCIQVTHTSFAFVNSNREKNVQHQQEIYKINKPQIYIYTYACMYVSMYVCMYVNISFLLMQTHALQYITPVVEDTVCESTTTNA